MNIFVILSVLSGTFPELDYQTVAEGVANECDLSNNNSTNKGKAFDKNFK